MEKKELFVNRKYFISWISLSPAYFIGFHFFFHTTSAVDYAQMAPFFLFLISAPFFSVTSGWLAYKGTGRVIYPNVITVVIMVLVNILLPILLTSSYTIRHYRPHPEELSLETLVALLLIAAPILVISIITSAITKRVIRKRNELIEKDEIE